jgi:hypothetical protein
MPQHGHPSSYNFDTLFICYRVGLGNDYSTVPTGNPLFSGHNSDARNTYIALANMAGCDMEMFKDGKRIDQRWSEEHKRALADYYANMDAMKTRYLQENHKGVLWHDENATRATLWNFSERSVALPGKVRDETTGEVLPKAETYTLQPLHTYSISGAPLPTQI